MANFIEESSEEILLKSMKNAFICKDESVVEELPEEEIRRREIATAIAESRLEKQKEIEKLEKELEEKIHYKSDKATTADEKEKEIVEKSVKNTITINPELKETIVGKIYAMYNNKYLDEKASYETVKKGEVLSAMKRQGRKLSPKDKDKIADKVVKDKGDTSKSDDRYAYESVEAKKKL